MASLVACSLPTTWEGAKSGKVRRREEGEKEKREKIKKREKKGRQARRRGDAAEIFKYAW